MTSWDDEGAWRIGELAAATGLTVRTLRHYDEIGLLVPSMRSSAGHRRYSSLDVRRLHLILALRGLGLALIDIGTSSIAQISTWLASSAGSCARSSNASPSRSGCAGFSMACWPRSPPRPNQLQPNYST